MLNLVLIPQVTLDECCSGGREVWVWSGDERGDRDILSLKSW